MNVEATCGPVQITAYVAQLRRRYGLALLALCAVLLLPELAGEWARAALRYERAAIAAGEWWRLVTAHLVHLDLEHAAAQCARARAHVGAVRARLSVHGSGWSSSSPRSPPSMPDCGSATRDVDWYVGASGALHGVMAAGTLAHVRRGDLDGWILAVVHRREAQLRAVERGAAFQPQRRAGGGQCSSLWRHRRARHRRAV